MVAVPFFADTEFRATAVGYRSCPGAIARADGCAARYEKDDSAESDLPTLVPAHLGSHDLICVAVSTRADLVRAPLDPAD
jgi:hypothetical protein